MMHFKSFAVAGLIGLLAAGCYTYDPPPAELLDAGYTQRKQSHADDLLKDINTLTLGDALRIAVANNPSYISAYHAVNAAKMRYYQAMGAFSPTVNATFTYGSSKNYSGSSGGYELDYSRNDYLTAGIRASWNVFNGLADYFSLRAAEHQENYYAALEEDACRVLLRGVTYAYNEIMLAKENIRIAESDRAFQQQCLKETQLKFDTGTVSQSEVLNFKILVNNAENNRIIAEADYEVAIYALAVLMGYPEGMFPDHVGFPSVDNTIDEKYPPVELYLDAAIANRPDLRGYRELLKVAEYQLKGTYSAYSPTLDLYAQYSYSHNKNTLNFEGTNPRSSDRRDTPSYDIGLSAGWSLFTGLVRYNQTREAYANLAAQQFTAANAWLSVVEEVRTSYTLYKRSILQAKLYLETLDYSVKQRDLVKKEFDAGLIGITRLNEVQNDLVSAQAQLASAHVNMKNAKVRLEAAANMNIIGYYHGETEAELRAAETAKSETVSIKCESPIDLTEAQSAEKPEDTVDEPANAQ